MGGTWLCVLKYQKFHSAVTFSLSSILRFISRVFRYSDNFRMCIIWTINIIFFVFYFVVFARLLRACSMLLPIPTPSTFWIITQQVGFCTVTELSYLVSLPKVMCVVIVGLFVHATVMMWGAVENECSMCLSVRITSWNFWLKKINLLLDIHTTLLYSP